jgi:Alkylmercury lyase
MAHPFTAVPLGFSVMGRDTLWWGGCAWDSFALPRLLPDQGPMRWATTCPACDQAHAWRVDDREPPAGGQVAHFLVPTARMWDDVVYTCKNQRIFCSEDCVAIWLNESGHQRGHRDGLGDVVAARGRLVRGPSRAWLCPPRAERCCRLPAQCRTLRHVLGSHLGVIDGGLPWVPGDPPRGESIADPAATSGPPSPAAPTKPASGTTSSAPNPCHRLNRAAAAWRSWCSRSPGAISA